MGGFQSAAKLILLRCCQWLLGHSMQLLRCSEWLLASCYTVRCSGLLLVPCIAVAKVHLAMLI